MFNQFDDFNRTNTITNQAEEFETVSEKSISIKTVIIYILVTVLLIGLIRVYWNTKYSNAEELVANIDVYQEISYTYGQRTDEYGETYYEIKVSGIVVNNNTETVPAIVVSVEFFDSEGKSIGTTDISREDVSPGETETILETVSSDVAPASMSAKIGIDETEMFYTVLNFAQSFVIAALFLMINKIGFKNDWKKFKSSKMKYIGYIILGVVIVYASMIVAQIIALTLGSTGTSENEMAIRSMFSDDILGIILLFFTLVVFTPIVEEMVFRKALFGIVEPKFGHVAAIISTGLIFGLMHVLSYGDYINSIPYVFMGLSFGFMYHYSGKNIFVTIGMHAINNFVAFTSYLAIFYFH